MLKFLILFFGIFFSFISSVHADEPARGLYVSVLDAVPVLSDRNKIDDLIDFSKKAGIKTLFVQIYRANKSWFPSKVADSSPYVDALKRVGEDPFALLISKAHEAGIEVHAWINLLSLSTNKNAFILKKYGLGVLTKNALAKQTIDDYKIDNQFFLEPSDPRVQKSLQLIVSEIVHRYRKLDGIQFDYIRYPDVHPFYGYSPNNMNRFKHFMNKNEIIESDPQWKQWKRDNVTNLLKRLIKTARMRNPKIHVSTTGCVSYSRAFYEALQDWPMWLNTHLVEFVTMMSYPIEVDLYKKNIAEFKGKINNFKDVNVAVGAYKLVKSPDVFIQQFNICNEAGARSCVIFHYSSLLESPLMEQYLIGDNTK